MVFFYTGYFVSFKHNIIITKASKTRLCCYKYTIIIVYVVILFSLACYGPVNFNTINPNTLLYIRPQTKQHLK